jgi:hypothetical protein
MAGTQATAESGVPVEASANAAGTPANALVPQAAAVTAKAPATVESPAAERLRATRQRLRDTRSPEGVNKKEGTLAAASGIAGMLAVAVVRRMLHRKRPTA